jgi:hypothetical protein
VYNGQICLITGEKADHGNAFPSSPPPFYHLLFSRFFFLLSDLRSFSILLYSFYYDFHHNFILQRKKLLIFLSFECANGTLSFSMLVVSDGWSARKQGDTCGERFHEQKTHA